MSKFQQSVEVKQGPVFSDFYKAFYLKQQWYKLYFIMKSIYLNFAGVPLCYRRGRRSATISAGSTMLPSSIWDGLGGDIISRWLTFNSEENAGNTCPFSVSLLSLCLWIINFTSRELVLYLISCKQVDLKQLDTFSVSISHLLAVFYVLSCSSLVQLSSQQLLSFFFFLL